MDGDSPGVQGLMQEDGGLGAGHLGSASGHPQDPRSPLSSLQVLGLMPSLLPRLGVSAPLPYRECQAKPPPDERPCPWDTPGGPTGEARPKWLLCHVDSKGHLARGGDPQEPTSQGWVAWRGIWSAGLLVRVLCLNLFE